MLTLYSGPPSVTAKTDSDPIQQLEAEIQTVSSEIDTLTARIRGFNNVMMEEHSNLVAQMNKVAAELADLQNDLTDRVREAQISDDMDALFPDEYEESEPEVESPRSLKKRCKKLYKLIAMQTHPDRTGDKNKWELFYRAKEYLAESNLSGLYSILDRLESSPGISSLFSALDERRKYLEDQLATMRKTLASILTGEDYTLYNLWRKNPKAVSDNYRILLEERFQLMCMQLHFLRSV